MPARAGSSAALVLLVDEPPVDEIGAVVGRDRRCRGLHAIVVRHASAIPDGARDDPRDAYDCLRGDASLMPGTARIGPMDTTGGRGRDEVRRRDGLEHAGRWCGSSAPTGMIASAGTARAAGPTTPEVNHLMRRSLASFGETRDRACCLPGGDPRLPHRS